MITHAFTCTGPYAVLIMLGIKRVENRSVLPVPHQGRCAVGCSKSFSAAEFGNFVQWASRALPAEAFARLPSWGDVKDWAGKVIGCCDYAAGRRDGAPYRGVAREAWDEGYAYWWELRSVVCFDAPIPCRGNVGMWQMPPELAAHVTAADDRARCVGKTIVTREDAARLFRRALSLVGGNEGVLVLPLDGERRVLAEPILVSLGDPTTVVVNPGEVFSAALKVDAKALILAHNHPSGDLTPSLQDRQLTEQMAALGDVLGVKVLDHMILG